MRRSIDSNWLIIVLASVVVIAGALFTAQSASANTIYDAAADFDAAYTAGNNPDGPWTYGWSSTLTSALTVYPHHSNYPSSFPITFEFWDDPNNWFSNTPFVAKNIGAEFSNSLIDIPAGALILHGGGIDHNDYTHVLWTAPVTATYSIAADFIGRQLAGLEGPGMKADVYVLYHGSILAQANILGYGQSSSYSSTLHFTAGDTIDFAVGMMNESVPHAGATELEATFTRLPEPGDWVLLAAGSLPIMVATYFRRRRAALMATSSE